MYTLDDWKKEEPEWGATYVIALAQEPPDPNSNPTEREAGENRLGVYGLRTLFKIYKLNEDTPWQPDDLKSIKLNVDFTLEIALTMDEMFYWIDYDKNDFHHFDFRALVFSDPYVGVELNPNELHNLQLLMGNLPKGIEVLSTGNYANVPVRVFIPYMYGRAQQNVVQLPFIKGVCGDFFVQFINYREPELALHVTHMTMDTMPNDNVVRALLDRSSHFQQRITFDEAEGKVHYTKLDRGGRDRGFYPLEPLLVALQARKQICVVGEVDFTYDRPRRKTSLADILPNVLGGVKNNVTEELVIILSKVTGLQATTAQSGSNQATTPTGGDRALGQRAQQAFTNAFGRIYDAYQALTKLRIIFTDKRIYTINNQQSYQALTNYMQDFSGILGHRQTRSKPQRPGLITAADVYQAATRRDNREHAVDVEIYGHQMLHVLYPQSDSKQWIRFDVRRLGGDPWELRETVPWHNRQNRHFGQVHRISHSSKYHTRGDPGDAYFKCDIQVTECGHPIRSSDDIPPDFRTVYGRDQQGTVQHGGFNRAESKFGRDLSAEALLRYRLSDDNPLPCYYEPHEWSTADPLEWVASRPLQPNSLAQGQPRETTFVED